MLFNSYTFLLFFIAVFVARNLPIPWSFKKTILIFSSYLFYAAWNPPFVLLLWISTVTDWWAGKWIHRSREKRSRRLFLSFSLFVNLGLLFYFKYADFFLRSFTQCLGWAGIGFSPIAVDVILPVGISFYTFQTLSYTIDIYRGKGRPWHSFIDYALYVSFFPQLVAGPIVRAFEFLPQCIKEKKVSPDTVAMGVSLLIFGLFQKIVLADAVFAPVAQSLYDSGGQPGFSSAWIGTLAFAGQILCDFSGYSTCAIGTAMCLGFQLPQNFRFPYAAIGFRDFWQRWHISLSSWLRDYVYISLGGNRNGRGRTRANILLTMLIGGLWHGAAWTFVIWGGLHGVLILMERILREGVGGWFATANRWSRRILRGLGGGLTFLLVCVAWVFFRASDLPHALDIVGAMFGFISGDGLLRLTGPDAAIAMGGVGLLLLGQWLLKNRAPRGRFTAVPWWLRSLGLAHMLIFIVLFYGEDRAFIYFQF